MARRYKRNLAPNVPVVVLQMPVSAVVDTGQFYWIAMIDYTRYDCKNLPEKICFATGNSGWKAMKNLAENWRKAGFME